LPVLILNQQKRRVNRRRLARIARTVMAAEGCPANAELSVVIGDDEWIQDLNRTYLMKDAPTDVLAFPQDAAHTVGTPLLGDVAISAETAARQAEQAGHSLEEELVILLIHGILHLTGWSDETPARRRRMMRRTTGLMLQMQQNSSR
jgi:probable rRNA maturation factor